MNICIYGGASNTVEQKYKDKVFELSKSLAKRGHGLVFGGGAHGMMGASARGFASENAKILGIVPEFFKESDFEPLFEGCTETIYTQEMYERKRLLETRADAYIIAPGGIGTFDEFFAVLTNKQLGQHTKPIAIYNIDGYYNELIEFLQKTIKLNFVPQTLNLLYKISDDVSEIINYIETDKTVVKSRLKLN